MNPAQPTSNTPGIFDTEVEQPRTLESIKASKDSLINKYASVSDVVDQVKILDELLTNNQETVAFLNAQLETLKDPENNDEKDKLQAELAVLANEENRFKRTKGKLIDPSGILVSELHEIDQMISSEKNKHDNKAEQFGSEFSSILPDDSAAKLTKLGEMNTYLVASQLYIETQKANLALGYQKDGVVPDSIQSRIDDLDKISVEIKNEIVEVNNGINEAKNAIAIPPELAANVATAAAEVENTTQLYKNALLKETSMQNTWDAKLQAKADAGVFLHSQENKSPRDESAVNIAQLEFAVADKENKLANTEHFLATYELEEATANKLEAELAVERFSGKTDLSAQEAAAKEARAKADITQQISLKAWQENAQKQTEEVRIAREAVEAAKAAAPPEPEPEPAPVPPVPPVPAPEPSADIGTPDVGQQKEPLPRTIELFKEKFNELNKANATTNISFVDSSKTYDINKVNTTTNTQEKYIQIDKTTKLVSGFLGKDANIDELAKDMVKAYIASGEKGPVIIKGDNKDLNRALEAEVAKYDNLKSVVKTTQSSTLATGGEAPAPDSDAIPTQPVAPH